MTAERIADTRKPGRQRALPPAPRQPGVPPGARQAARRERRAARRGGVLRRTRCATGATPTRPPRATGWSRRSCARAARARRRPGSPRCAPSGAASPMIETLAARVQQARRRHGRRARHAAPGAAALSRLAAAALRPTREALRAGRARPSEALAALAEPMRLYPRDLRLRALQAQIYAGARQAPAAAPGAGRGLRAAGQPAGGDRAAAARAGGRRRQLLRALGDRCAPEGTARAAHAGDAQRPRSASARVLRAPRNRLRTAGRRSFPPRASSSSSLCRAAHRALQQRLHAGGFGHRRAARLEEVHDAADARERRLFTRGRAARASARRSRALSLLREARALEAVAERAAAARPAPLSSHSSSAFRVDEAADQPGAGEAVGPQRLARGPGAPAQRSPARRARPAPAPGTSAPAPRPRRRPAPARRGSRARSGRNRARRWPRTRGAACAARARARSASDTPKPTRRLSMVLISSS